MCAQPVPTTMRALQRRNCVEPMRWSYDCAHRNLINERTTAAIGSHRRFGGLTRAAAWLWWGVCGAVAG